MALLKQHLSPAVRSSIAVQLNGPKQYFGALRSLRTWYDHPKLVAKAHMEALKNVPSAKTGDLDSPVRFGSALNDALNNLSRAGLINTIRLESELEEMLHS